MNEKQYGSLPIGKLLRKIIVPSMISMMVSSLYHVVDGMFVGTFIGTEALAAISIMLPVFVVSYSIPNMIAVGSSIKIGVALGEGDNDKASRIFSATALLITILGFVLSGLSVLFAKPIIMAALGSYAIADSAYKYAIVFMLAYPVSMHLFSLDNALRSCGKNNYAMYVNITVSVLNIILDAIFIAWLGLGLEWAAIASVISLCIGAVLSVLPFVTGKLTLRFVVPSTSVKEIFQIVANGVSEFLNANAFALTTFVFNAVLLRYGGPTAVAAFVIVLYVDNIVMSLLFGMIDAIQPAISYNYGARLIPRLLHLCATTIKISQAIMYPFMVAMLLFPTFFIGLFAQPDDTELITLAWWAFMLYAPHYLIGGYNLLVDTFLPSIEKPKKGIILSFTRGIVLPMVYLFALLPVMGVYACFVTTTLSHATTWFGAMFVWGKTKDELQELDTTTND